MILDSGAQPRKFRMETLGADLVVVGGGLSGICGSITAARQGLKVVLVQDRSVLGGNASSEVRLWILGATSHMGNNNRWAREGGVVDEILVENTYRNPEGNPVLLDALLLDKVTSESNITLLLNTAVYEVNKKDAEHVDHLKAYCSQNQTEYELKAPLFCDASGDGVVGFLSGAAFRMGAENKEEFDELFAPDKSYGELLGHSLYFYSKDTGAPVKFIAPSFALDDITKIPRFRGFSSSEYGCKLWWIEFGGRMDTVHDTEKIKWELWKIVYGVWNHIKNSGRFPEAENLTLEWVGMIPGKRESRRFEGDYMLIQQDVVEQRWHADAVGFGGWSIDLHPSDGVYSDQPGCNQWHSKGVYHIPYRCTYSKNIKNLFLAGRIVSTSHVAFGSSRVMATSAYIAQATGMAAKICAEQQCLPAELCAPARMQMLQAALQASGQYIPGLVVREENDLVQTASVTASSTLVLSKLPEDGELLALDTSAGQLLPVAAGAISRLYFNVFAEKATSLQVELCACSRVGSFTPDKVLERFSFDLEKGRNQVAVTPTVAVEVPQYIFVLLRKNIAVKVPRSRKRITGVLSVFNTVNPAVSNYGKQEAPEGIGMDSFEFWCPQRRPAGHNIALRLENPVDAFEANNIKNGIARPVTQPNAWVAAFEDPRPVLELCWNTRKRIKKVVLSFDTDADHPMESVLMTHPEPVMPFCVRNYKIFDDTGRLVYQKTGNYQTRNEIVFDERVVTTKLIVEAEHPSVDTPAAIFEIRAYE